MTENSNTSNNSTGFSDAELASIVALKEVINTELLQALPTETSGLVSDNGVIVQETNDPYAEDFLSIIDKFFDDETLLRDNPALQEVLGQYASLSDNVKAHISSYSADFAQGDNATSKVQSLNVIRRAHDALDIENSMNDMRVTLDGQDGYVVSAEFGDAFLDKVNKLKAEGTGDENSAFSSVKQSGDMAVFLEGLLKKQLEDAGIQQSNLSRTLTDLRTSSEQASTDHMMILHTQSLLDMARLMSDGSLPSGGNDFVFVLPPLFDGTAAANAPQTELAEDRFFSLATYTSLNSGQEVDARVFFLDHETNPNVELLKRAADALDIDTTQGTLSQSQVGDVARLMLEYQACKLGIDKDEITAAIHEGVKTDCFEGRFMPNTDDLLLAASGIDYPPELLARAQENGIEEWRIQFEYAQEVHELRNEAWEKDFGALPDSVIVQKLAGYSAEQRATIGDERLEQVIRENSTTPHKFFENYGAMFGDHSPSQYERDRQEYLANSALVFEGDADRDLGYASRGDLDRIFREESAPVDEIGDQIDEFVAQVNSGALPPVEITTVDPALTRDPATLGAGAGQ